MEEEKANSLVERRYRSSVSRGRRSRPGEFHGKTLQTLTRPDDVENRRTGMTAKSNEYN